jgi:hypothetical protein
MEIEFIYFVIAVGIGIYQWYKKAKEKEEQQKRTRKAVEPAKQPVDIEKMLEELLNPNKKVAEVKKLEEVKPVQAEFTGNEDAQKSADQAYEFDADKYYEELKKKENEEVARNNMSLETQMMSEIGQSDTPVVAVVEERAEDVNVNEWLTAGSDDIRKAIIWSEILKRPAWAN